MRIGVPHLILACLMAVLIAGPAGAQAIAPHGAGLPGKAHISDVVAGTTLVQQRDPVGSFFKKLFGGFTRKTPPARKAAPTTRSTSRSGSGPVLLQRKQQPKVARKAEDAKRVVVFGDFFAAGLEKGLHEAFLASSSVIVEGLNSASSGLVRDDHYNWPAAMAGRLLDPANPTDIAVIMIGGNDRQALRDENGEHAPRSERWRELYAARIDQVIKVFTDKNVPLYFVSLPPVASGQMSRDYAYINEILRERAYRYGVEFVDIWNSFVDEAGNYTATGPDVNGEIRQLRAQDGLNFTQSGNRKLAHFIAREIRRDFGREGGLFLALPGGPTGPQPFLPSDNQIRTGVGEVVALTGARGGSGTSLAGGPDPTPKAPRDSAYFQVILEGETPETAPGRADDFSWPRQSTTLSRAVPPKPEAETPEGEQPGEGEQPAG